MANEITNLLEKAHISLLLDNYDALFSDFDPRPYNERAISDDFLVHLKRAVRQAKLGNFEMNFLIPKHLKNAHEEEIIRDRLRLFFHQQRTRLLSETKGVVQKGILLTVLGFILMFGSSVISQYFNADLSLDFLRVVMEPSGWFLVWYGLDQIFYVAKSQKPELEFYHKMSKADIYFEAF